MFDPSETPRVFAMPPGADFVAELAKGIVNRLMDRPPQAMARVTVLVNTRRMQRRLKTILASDAPRLLPRIGLVTELDALLPAADLPPPISPLRRRLELISLIGKLIEADPSLAPRAASVDLADSLAALIDEIQGEGVDPETVLNLDVSDVSGHWARSLRFLSIVRDYVEHSRGKWLDAEARQRLAASRLLDMWTKTPPNDPIIVAGSTGSRATTAMLMQAVASLPQGAVVLPGYDSLMPDELFNDLTGAGTAPLGSEDHPQFRFARFLELIGLDRAQVAPWGAPDHRERRNALISLSLRPAPVTDQWRTEGPDLGDLVQPTQAMSLLEAPDPKVESVAIAIALRTAIEDGKTAALITPDRTLGRRVAATLQRWDIVPDDSAGRPLSLTAPGRFLRQVAGLIGGSGDPIDVIAALKHPLAMSGSGDRGPHLRLTRELELFVRRNAIAGLSAETVAAFARERPQEDHAWCAWLTDWLTGLTTPPAPTLAGNLDHHMSLAEQLASGRATGSGGLWEQTAGRDALALVAKFEREADYPGPLPFTEYLRLFERALSAESTRNYDTARPDLMIWGTLEARVQGADLVVLGGLNEGVWPEQPAADPWLNRQMRRNAGLLLPERQIGLSAHDYQQAVAAREVILSRAKRDADSETVPSRWLARLTNLLDGLPDQDGPAALAQMKARGAVFIHQARLLDAPRQTVDPEPRPAPAPPVALRPTDYSVTEIQRLIRDPYAIYARHILGLTALNPLKAVPDARLKGTVFHKIVETAFPIDARFDNLDEARHRLLDAASRHIGGLPWPGIAALWRAHVEAISEQLVADEQARRKLGTPLALEVKGRIAFPGTPFAVHGKADRIDRLTSGGLVIYDYKSGTPPQEKVIRFFDRQLPVEAVMAEQGGFDGIPAEPVSHVVHLGLGRSLKSQVTELKQTDEVDLRTVTIQGELLRLFTAYHADGKGYPSRRAMEKVRYDGDYDHVARFGEWDETSDPLTVRLP